MLESPTIFNPFAGPEIAHLLRITDSQEELWHSCLFGGEDANRAYNESLSLVLTGDLDYDALQKAFLTLIQRHESLRAAFSPDGKFMCIFSQVEFKIDFHDLSNLSAMEKKAQTDGYLNEDAHRSFDLINGPLIRVGLLKLEEEKHHLVITTHHIVCDGWSYGIILQELGALYSANVQNTPHKLPDAISYSQYAKEQREFSENGAIKKVEAYWLDLYSGEVPQLNMPVDNPRPSQRSYQGKRFDQSLDDKLIAELRKTGAKVNCSLVVTLMAAFEIFLYELTGQKSFSLGLPTAGQSAMGAKHLIGHCVNLLPLKTEIDIQSSFVDQLQRRKSANFDAFDHQELTFGHLLKKLNIERNPARIPLVPVVLNIDMGIDDDVSFSGLNYELLSNPREYETFELFLNATGSNESLILEWSYNSNLFEKCSIMGMVDSFEALLQKLVAQPEQKLSDLTVKKTPNYEIKGPDRVYPQSTLHQLFDRQAHESPRNLALQLDSEHISYGDLQKRINQTAQFLWERGVRPDQTVAISLDRSPDLIICIFAVLQCGAAYVPIDTSYPDGRIKLMVIDSAATFYIGDGSKRNLSLSTKNITIEEIHTESSAFEAVPLDIYVSTESPAYIIYTSGSTGKPKGVQVAHSNVINLVNSMAKEPGITSEDKIFAVTTISFDATVMEIFLPLLHGASIVFVDEETRRDGHLLLKKAVNDGITMMWGTPTIYQILVDSGWKDPLPIKALIGGEAVPLPLARQLLKKCHELWNIYGPTETTVCAFLTRITENDDPITIGRPVSNTHAYLLDEYGNPVAKGEEGEIVIGGDGVSLGYLNRPELNENSFLDDPFRKEKGKKMYRSGDMGKLLPNGQLQCLGRRDRQVKVRGHRIELGEIEYILKELPGVKTAATDVQNHLLKAYIISSKDTLGQEEAIRNWKEQLTAELPAYMVPQEFIFLEELPVTSNGKLDRKRLAQLASTNSKINFGHTGPRNAAEKLIADIWKECLRLEQLDIYSSFFELGGHSLVAAKVMTQLEEKTGKRLPLASLFEHSTVEKLALLLEANDSQLTWGSLVPIRSQGSKPPIFIVHGAGLNVLNFSSLVKFMDDDQPIYGLQAKGLNGLEDPLTTVEEIAAHYNAAISSVRPNGPYSLAGYSFGGVIAYEMAKQFKEKGEKVNTLVLLDTYAFPPYGRKTQLGKTIANTKYFFAQKFHSLKKGLGSKEGFKEKMGNIGRGFGRILSGNILEKTEEFELQNERAAEIRKIHDRATDKYHLKPQHVRIDLVRVNKDPEYKHDPIFLGWRSFALDGVELHRIPGNHTEMFTPPNDKISAETLQGILDANNVNE